VYETAPVVVEAGEGALTDNVGAFATINVVLGPASGQFPAALLAVHAPMLIPRVPFPVMEDIVTVRVLFPVPLTETVPLALPVASSVTSAFDRVMLPAPV